MQTQYQYRKVNIDKLFCWSVFRREFWGVFVCLETENGKVSLVAQRSMAATSRRSAYINIGQWEQIFAVFLISWGFDHGRYPLWTAIRWWVVILIHANGAESGQEAKRIDHSNPFEYEAGFIIDIQRTWATPSCRKCAEPYPSPSLSPWMWADSVYR